jgi:hypothetical protein
MMEKIKTSKEIIEEEIANCKAMIVKINEDSNSNESALVVKCVQIINEHLNKLLETLEVLYSTIK